MPGYFSDELNDESVLKARVVTEMNEIRPFSNATEFDCWTSANCCRCEKYYIVDENYWSTCKIENALALWTLTRTVSEEIAIRMGMVKDDEEWIHYRKCTELVPLIRWHIIGELDNKTSPMFGPFNSIDEAEVKLKVAPFIMQEMAPYTKLDLNSIQLSIKQTDSNELGQIDAFVEKLSRWQVKAAFEWCAAKNPTHLQSIEERIVSSINKYCRKIKIQPINKYTKEKAYLIVIPNTGVLAYPEYGYHSEWYLGSETETTLKISVKEYARRFQC